MIIRRVVGDMLPVAAEAVEVARSSAYAGTNRCSCHQVMFGDCSDGSATQRSDGGAAHSALFGRRHVGTAAETECYGAHYDYIRWSHGNDLRRTVVGQLKFESAPRREVPVLRASNTPRLDAPKTEPPSILPPGEGPW